MPTCVIFNPAARGNKARHFRRHVNDLGGGGAFKPTTGPGTASTLSTEAVREGFDTIVAAGGDGTLNEVLNGIGDAPEGFARARLGVLPLGTVNVFAKELGLPMNLAKAWEVVRRGRERTIDLPCVEFSAEGKPRRRYFAQMAGAGLDAQAIALTDWELKKKIGQFAYVAAGIRALRGPLPQIEFTDGQVTATGELVLIGNGRFYGGRLPVFRNASLTDGRLDVCVFPRVRWLTVARYALGFLTGRVLPPATMRYFQAERLTLRSASPALFELEGETAGSLPAVFSVQRGALRVVAP